jgi:hypothetical protein
MCEIPMPIMPDNSKRAIVLLESHMLKFMEETSPSQIAIATVGKRPITLFNSMHISGDKLPQWRAHKVLCAMRSALERTTFKHANAKPVFETSSPVKYMIVLPRIANNPNDICHVR